MHCGVLHLLFIRRMPASIMEQRAKRKEQAVNIDDDCGNVIESRRFENVLI